MAAMRENTYPSPVGYICSLSTCHKSDSKKESQSYLSAIKRETEGVELEHTTNTGQTARRLHAFRDSQIRQGEAEEREREGTDESDKTSHSHSTLADSQPSFGV